MSASSTAPTLPRIFLSYAREDEARAEQLYQQLNEAGFRPWMDTRDLLPGEISAIKRAIQDSDFFVACLSEIAVRKRSYIRREIRGAVARREEMLEHDIYLIPVRLEECDVPEELRAHQWLDLFKPNGWERLVKALRVGRERRGKTLPGPVSQAQNTFPTSDGSQTQQSQADRQEIGGPNPVVSVGSLPLELTNSIGRRFMLVPAGEFEMGANDGHSDERPVHRVQISRPFYLGKHPVTQAEWEAVVGENPSYFKGVGPVEQVVWEDAQEFVRRLNEKEPGLGYRLPTEAEWEYAARAGSTAAYCFGDEEDQLGEYGWYAQNAGGETHQVGQLKGNSWGLRDMHGNVWEWVQDWYGKYSEQAVTDPSGPVKGTDRVIRGGSWDHGARPCRSAFRFIDGPSHSWPAGSGSELSASTAGPTLLLQRLSNPLIIL